MSWEFSRSNCIFLALDTFLTFVSASAVWALGALHLENSPGLKTSNIKHHFHNALHFLRAKKCASCSPDQLLLLKLESLMLPSIQKTKRNGSSHRLPLSSAPKTHSLHATYSVAAREGAGGSIFLFIQRKAQFVCAVPPRLGPPAASLHQKPRRPAQVMSWLAHHPGRWIPFFLLRLLTSL